MTVATWVAKTLWTADARECIRLMAAQLCGCDAAHLSFLYFLHYIRTAGSVEALVEVRVSRKCSHSAILNALSPSPAPPSSSCRSAAPRRSSGCRAP